MRLHCTLRDGLSARLDPRSRPRVETLNEVWRNDFLNSKLKCVCTPFKSCLIAISSTLCLVVFEGYLVPLDVVRSKLIS